MVKYREKSNENEKENSGMAVRTLFIIGGVLTALTSAAFTMHVLATPTYGAVSTSTQTEFVIVTGDSDT